MSEFHVRVVRVGKLDKHPNADSLSITDVEGYPVIVKTGKFQEGNLAVYIPVDSIVPDTEQWSFLQGKRRIRAKKIRGVFSMGMLEYLPPMRQSDSNPDYVVPWCVGDNVQKEMGIEKWEPVDYSCPMQTENESTPKRVNPDNEECELFPKYTDIEGYRKYKHILKEGEEVVLSEKLHGSNARYAVLQGRLWAGSHNYFKKPGQAVKDIWWQVAEQENLEEKLSKLPGIGFYGEIFGKVQKGFDYGYAGKLTVRFFDAIDTQTGKYLDYADFLQACEFVGVETVPVLYCGPWKTELTSLSEGPTTFNAEHTREGFVVKPVHERMEPHFGRVILKFVGEGYLLNKNA